MQQHEDLFNGKLGTFKPYEIELELKANASPKASRAYPVPIMHLSAYKRRLEEMIMLGVLEHASRSEWIHGTFIIPKKDASTHWISDLHSLNMSLIHKVYPIPKITELLYKCQGYKYVTILDLSNHCYTFVIKENCHHLLTPQCPLDFTGINDYHKEFLSVQILLKKQWKAFSVNF